MMPLRKKRRVLCLILLSRLGLFSSSCLVHRWQGSCFNGGRHGWRATGSSQRKKSTPTSTTPRTRGSSLLPAVWTSRGFPHWRPLLPLRNLQSVPRLRHSRCQAPMPRPRTSGRRRRCASLGGTRRHLPRCPPCLPRTMLRSSRPWYRLAATSSRRRLYHLRIIPHKKSDRDHDRHREHCDRSERR